MAAVHFSFRPEMVMMSHLLGDPGAPSLASPASWPFSWTAGCTLGTGGKEKRQSARAGDAGYTLALPRQESRCVEGKAWRRGGRTRAA